MKLPDSYINLFVSKNRVMNELLQMENRDLLKKIIIAKNQENDEEVIIQMHFLVKPRFCAVLVWNILKRSLKLGHISFNCIIAL